MLKVNEEPVGRVIGEDAQKVVIRTNLINMNRSEATKADKRSRSPRAV